MSTTAQTIITETLDELLVLDKGRSELGNDNTELLARLNRILYELYRAAARPPQDDQRERNDFFAVTASVALSAGAGTLSAYAWMPRFVEADGTPVALTTRAAVLRGEAELPPAVYVQSLTVTSPLRSGDPAAADTLTAHYTPLPGPLTDVAHYVGATTPATASTSKWPDHHNQALVKSLVRYLVHKGDDLDAATMQLADQAAEAAVADFLVFVRAVQPA